MRRQRKVTSHPTAVKNQKKYISWLKKTFPELYTLAIEKVNEQSLSGMGEEKSGDGWGDFFGNMISTVTKLAPQVLQYKQANAMIKTQSKRAAQGLPPIQTAAYTQQMPAQPSRTRAPLVTKPSMFANMTGNMPLILGGVALVAFLLLKKKRR